MSGGGQFILILCLSILSFLGCLFYTDANKTPEEKAAIKREQSAYVNKGITYVHDEKTNLCFAVYKGYNSAGMTVVPCDALKGILVQ